MGEQNKGPFINVNGLKGNDVHGPWAWLQTQIHIHAMGKPNGLTWSQTWAWCTKPKPKSKANRGGLKNPSQTQAQNFIFLQLASPSASGFSTVTTSPRRQRRRQPALASTSQHQPAPASTSQHQPAPAPAPASTSTSQLWKNFGILLSARKTHFSLPSHTVASMEWTWAFTWEPQPRWPVRGAAFEKKETWQENRSMKKKHSMYIYVKKRKLPSLTSFHRCLLKHRHDI